ncbi:23S rRNA (guanosine(2251)-2'-O)-methyltransferase RlmB [Spirochaetia bacterium]|nr:23S rRNA (guanosine(2251)-2'-O)-methyltransferase RlmB [Spirochaetia bacterium]
MAYLTGFHSIEERIKYGGGISLLVAKAGPRARELVELALSKKVPVVRVGTNELDRISNDHRGIALEVEDAAEDSANLRLEDFIAGLGDQEKNKNVLVVVLDEITDPHNFGAILRSCDQFGVNLVITRNKRTAKHADIIAKTSAGAAAWVPSSEVPNLPRAVEQLKEAGFWIYGADMKGDAVYKQKLKGRVCLILGGEGSGISRLLRESCDALLSIPSKGRVDSLNVSVAAGIFFYEIIRQR